MALLVEHQGLNRYLVLAMYKHSKYDEHNTLSHRKIHTESDTLILKENHRMIIVHSCSYNRMGKRASMFAFEEFSRLSTCQEQSPVALSRLLPGKRPGHI